MKIAMRLVAMLLLLANNLVAQMPGVAPALGPLKIGDAVPDVKISGLLNYPRQTVRFSDFKGKLVLLDFWFGACPGCIDLFPKMEALQKRFGDSLQIILVNFESARQIEATMTKFRNKSANYRKPLLPMVVDDTLFHRLFAVRYYPHEVWIDQEGVVRATTEGTQVNEANLGAMIRRQPVKLDMKADDMNFDDMKSPVFSQLYASKPERLRYYSVLFGYAPGIVGTGVRLLRDSASQTLRAFRENMSLLELFANAVTDYDVKDPFESPRFDYGKRVVFNVQDTSRYYLYGKQSRTEGEWDESNRFTYELVAPMEAEPRLGPIMLADFERFFNATCRLERRKMKCLVLVTTPGVDKIKSKEGKALSAFDPRLDSTKFQLYGGNTNWLVEAFSRAFRQTPFVFANGTGYTGLIDVVLEKADFSSLSRIRTALQHKYQLDLVEREADVEVLVVEDLARQHKSDSEKRVLP